MSSRVRIAAGLLVAGILITGAAGCGSSPSGKATGPSVTCTSFPIHGTGTYHDEVQVQVEVSNRTGSPADYQAEVIITLAGEAAANGPMHVMVSGLVPAGSSAVLSRKVLTAGKALHCTVGKLSQS